MRYVWCAMSTGARLFTVFAWLLLITIVAAVGTAHAQVTSTRIESASWTCRDASGAVLTSHERQDKAQEECTNRALKSPGVAFQILPSGYRIVYAPVTTTPPDLTAPTITGALSASNTVTLTWLAVTGATAYEIERCAGPTCTGFALRKSQPDLQYVEGPLPGGLTLKYRVRAIDATRKGPYSDVWTVATPVATTGSATVQWEAPVTNSDGSALVDLAGYHIVYGTDPAQLSQQIDVANVTSYVVNGLTPGSWFFAVRAYNSSGAESANSNVASKVVQ